MLKKIKDIGEKLKQNKVLKIAYNVIYAILYIIVILMLIVVLIQRFSNNNLSLKGYRLFNIVTGSMVPKYLVGDVLLSKEVPVEKLKVGDDIVYLGNKSDFAGKYITHEIIQIEKNEYGLYKIHTKGLANEFADPVITSDQVKGVVVYRFVIFSFISKLANNLYSMYFAIFVPIAIIIFMNIIRISSNKEKENKEN